MSFSIESSFLSLWEGNFYETALNHHKTGLMALMWIGNSWQATAQPQLIDAIDQLVNQFRDEIPLLQQKVNSAAITSVEYSEEIDGSVKNYLLSNLEGVSIEDAKFRFTQCKECLVPRGEIEGQRVLIKKGLTTREDVERLTRNLGITHYTEAALIYSGRKLILTLNFFDAQNRQLAWSGSYKTRLVRVSDSPFVFSFAAYLGLPSGTEEQNLGNPIYVQFTAHERIYGMGGVGLYLLRSVSGSPSYTSVGPHFMFNINEMFSSPWNWGSLSLEAFTGLGFYTKRDITVGAGLRLDFGSTYFFNFRYLSGFSSGQKDTQTEDVLPGTIAIGFGLDLF